VRRNPSLPSERFDVLAGPLIKLRSHPSFDIDFASLPAEARDDHRRWRVKTLSVLGANVADDLRLGEFVHRRRAPLPCPPGRFAAAGSGDKSTFAGLCPSALPNFAVKLSGVSAGSAGGAPSGLPSFAASRPGDGLVPFVIIMRCPF
jgi:hypothetical protein